MLTEIKNHVPEFANAIGEPGLGKLAAVSVLITVPAGRKIIRDQQPVGSLYLVLQGQLAAIVEQNTWSRRVGKIGPGEWLGDVSVLSGAMVASSSVVAEREVRLLRLSHQAFNALIADADDLANSLMRHMVRQLADRLRNARKFLIEHPVATSDLPIPETQPNDALGWLGRILGARANSKPGQ